MFKGAHQSKSKSHRKSRVKLRLSVERCLSSLPTHKSIMFLKQRPCFPVGNRSSRMHSCRSLRCEKLTDQSFLTQGRARVWLILTRNCAFFSSSDVIGNLTFQHCALLLPFFHTTRNRHSRVSLVVIWTTDRSMAEMRKTCPDLTLHFGFSSSC